MERSFIPLRVVLVPEPAVDPVGEPDRVREQLADYRSLGATHLNPYLRHQSEAHCVEQMDAFVEVMAARRRSLVI
jgi:alkanesulfonate monooxygenase SsuD/methylene tetrahydromethanopterin reductase-like flavin-dependent oxidoreductase (luciferase family)